MVKDAGAAEPDVRVAARLAGDGGLWAGGAGQCGGVLKVAMGED